MNIAAFAGALRRDSTSKRLLREVAQILGNHDIALDLIDLKDYDFPVYDTDIEESSGIPPAISALGDRLSRAEAWIIASPEYNGGISSVLKTVIDWLSRLKPNPFADKFLLLLSASPSGSGGVLGLWHTRAPFDALGVHVFPKMVAIPRSHAAFDDRGVLTDEKSRHKLEDAVRAFVQHVGRAHAAGAAGTTLPRHSVPVLGD